MIKDESSFVLKIARFLRKHDGGAASSTVHVDQDATLVLIGYPPHGSEMPQGTSFHLDRLCATNVGFALSTGSDPDIKEPIAVWYVVCANDWEDVQEVAARMKLNLTEDVIPEAVARRLSDALGRTPCGMFPKLRIQHQFSGDVFRIVAGTYHSVVNVRPNVKLAFDVADDSLLCLYAKVLREYFAEDVSSDDYGCLEGILSEIVVNFAARIIGDRKRFG